MDLKADSLHRAVCPPCVEHEFRDQWGKCGSCGHAKKAVCHIDREAVAIQSKDEVIEELLVLHGRGLHMGHDWHASCPRCQFQGPQNGI